MTKHECAIISAYTAVKMLEGRDVKYLYDYLSSLEGRAINENELAAVIGNHTAQIREDFTKLWQTATE